MMSKGANLYFGGTLIVLDGVMVATDRLGSVRANMNGEQFAYYPYGKERTSTPDWRVKFGTYTHYGTVFGVSEDYADQRYYSSTTGSFWSPDPLGIAAANPKDPGSWNRYAYAGNDPINRNDPTGRMDCQSYMDYQRSLPGDLGLDDMGLCGNYGDGSTAESGGGGGAACYGSYLEPAPNPACYAPVPEPPAPEPSRLLPFECEATQYYRPVDDWRAKAVGATHSYWEIEEYDPNSKSDIFNTVLAGGPNAVTDPKTGNTTTYLNVWVHAPTSGPDQPTNGTESFGSDLSSLNCASVNSMMAAALLWPANIVTYGFQNYPNSNSVAHALGQVGGFNPSAPPGSWGWNP